MWRTGWDALVNKTPPPSAATGGGGADGDRGAVIPATEGGQGGAVITTAEGGGADLLSPGKAARPRSRISNIDDYIDDVGGSHRAAGASAGQGQGGADQGADQGAGGGGGADDGADTHDSRRNSLDTPAEDGLDRSVSTPSARHRGLRGCPRATSGARARTDAGAVHGARAPPLRCLECTVWCLLPGAWCLVRARRQQRVLSPPAHALAQRPDARRPTASFAIDQGTLGEVCLRKPTASNSLAGNRDVAGSPGSPDQRNSNRLSRGKITGSAWC